jgi:hypothetical protein
LELEASPDVIKFNAHEFEKIFGKNDTVLALMTNKSEADSKEIYDNFKEVAKKHKERIVSVEFNLTVGIGQ